MSAGVPVTVSLAANTLTDALGTALNGQRNFTITDFPVTNNLSGSSIVVAVEKFRIRRWGSSISSNAEGDWLLPLSTTGVARNDGALVAIAWQLTANGGDPTQTGYSTEFCAVDTSPCTPNIATTDSCATNPLCYNNTDTSQAHGAQITTTRFANPEPTFIAGGVVASTQGYPQPLLVNNSATEIQGAFAIQNTLPNGRVVCVRPVAQSGTALTHSVTACLTMQPPIGGSAS